MILIPSSCSAVAREVHSLRHVVNFIAGDQTKDISLVAYLLTSGCSYCWWSGRAPSGKGAFAISVNLSALLIFLVLCMKLEVKMSFYFRNRRGDLNLARSKNELRYFFVVMVDSDWEGKREDV